MPKICLLHPNLAPPSCDPPTSTHTQVQSPGGLPLKTPVSCMQSPAWSLYMIAAPDLKTTVSVTELWMSPQIVPPPISPPQGLVLHRPESRNLLGPLRPASTPFALA